MSARLPIVAKRKARARRRREHFRVALARYADAVARNYRSDDFVADIVCPVVGAVLAGVP